MASAKAYKPMDYVECLAYITRHSTVDVDSWDEAQVYTYAETLRLHYRIDEIENQANEMMSPDKMMEMAQSFLGGGLR